MKSKWDRKTGKNTNKPSQNQKSKNLKYRSIYTERKVAKKLRFMQSYQESF